MNRSLAVLALILQLAVYGIWVWRVSTIGTFRRRRMDRWPLLAAPAIGLFVLTWTLMYWADPRIWESDPFDFFLFLAGGWLWVCMAAKLFGLLNLNLFHDSLANHNRASIYAASGGLLGAFLVYAGGNIGSGDGELTTVASVLLAGLGWFASWWVFEIISHISESISVGRDLASGVRLTTLLITLGLIYGRSVAGDWISMGATIRDFVRGGWPGICLSICAGGLDRVFQPDAARPARGIAVCGLFPAAVYLLFTAGWLIHLGKW